MKTSRSLGSAMFRDRLISEGIGSRRILVQGGRIGYLLNCTMRKILKSNSRPLTLLALLLALLAGLASSATAGECVFLLHGLARSSGSMNELELKLGKAGYAVHNLEYDSRRAVIDTLATRTIGTALADSSAAPCDSIHFVTHSLGGILVRVYLERNAVPHLGRVVMLGPPNNGSEVVDRLKEWSLFQVVNGPAGAELGTDSASVPRKLGPVTFELGVIAGKLSINWINSLMIPGVDDGKVSVESTKVSGMRDHIALETTHPMMMTNDKVIEQVVEFLQHGKFRHD